MFSQPILVLIFLFVVETGPYFVAQAGLELVMRLSWAVARELGPQVSCPAPFPLWTLVSPVLMGAPGPLLCLCPVCVSVLMCAGAHVEMRTEHLRTSLSSSEELPGP